MRGGYDYVIIGSGIYGMYAAKLAAEKGYNTLILECDDRPFTRASYINQARVHNGYHYPRSFSTAIKSAKYFDRFCKDFDFAINNRFKKIYAISSKFSLTSGDQFLKFCQHANVPCERVDTGRYFNKNTIEAAFETLEYAFDARKISDYLASELASKQVKTLFNTTIIAAEKLDSTFRLSLSNGEQITAKKVLNCSYASTNQINRLFGYEEFRIKYEIAEVILCEVSDNLRDVGITVMDGPFFSTMPFGDTGLHTLTAVTFTPHKTCYDRLPRFNCQSSVKGCTPEFLCNCNTCQSRPETAMPYMNQLAKKYLHSDMDIRYKSSLFAIKPILLASEIDDSRPTLIKQLSDSPAYYSVLSGKINTVYDMEGVII